MKGKSILHYHIGEKLGEGGMGVVYRAVDTRLQRTVALKFPPVDWTHSRSAKQRLIREARAASALNHPNIATIHAVEDLQTHPFIVMECVDGRTLTDILQEGGLAVEQVLEIARQVAAALQAAHELGIIHRDIKPDNIMLTSAGLVKVMDFGIARQKRLPHLSGAGATIGTAAYMSPEQAQADELDERSDIFSLGCVLFELVSGQPPFAGAFEAEVLYTIVNESPDPLTNYRADIPPQLAQIISTCMEKSRADRYQTARALGDDLAALQNRFKLADARVHWTSHSRSHFSIAVLALAGILLASGFWAVMELMNRQSPRFVVQETRRITRSPARIEMQPSLSPDGNQMVYDANLGGNMDIWLHDIESAETQNLTPDFGGTDRWPSWSPDGSEIVFSSERNGGGIFLVSPSGGPARQISTLEGQPRWSRDAQYLVFESEHKLYIIARDGSDRSIIPNAGFAAEPAWSPDGKRIVYARHRDGAWGISAIRTDGSERVDVIDGSKKNPLLNPQWSADGTTIFYKSSQGGSRDIWAVPVDRSGNARGPEYAVTAGVSIYHFSLARNDSAIAYMLSTRSVQNIWSFKPDFERTKLMSDAEKVFSVPVGTNHDPLQIAVSPDRRRIAYSDSRRGNSDIWILDRKTGEKRQFTSHSGNETWPAWSPDGEYIAFQFEQNGQLNVLIQPEAGGVARELSSLHSDITRPSWSPQGDKIAVTALGNGNCDIEILSVHNGEPGLKLQLPEQQLLPAWSPDGKFISFVSGTRNRNELFIAAVGDTGMNQLTNFSKLAAFGINRNKADARTVWMPDGQHLLTTWQSEAGQSGHDIYAISTLDGSMRKLLDFRAWDGSHGMIMGVAAFDGEHIYFIERLIEADIAVAKLEQSTP